MDEEMHEDFLRAEMAVRARRLIAMERARAEHTQVCASIEQDYADEIEAELKRLIERLAAK